MKISLIFKLVLILIFLVLGFVYFPIPSLKIDKLEPFELTESHFSMIQASHNLYRPFPEMITRSDNPTTAEKSELGRLLYFDSVLSGNNDISCAHCHHPDLGFSDNRGLSMGKGGKGLGQTRNGGTIIRRGSPTIWNTAYNHRQFWDGRALDLEDQAQNPIQHKDEMAQNPEELIGELRALPEYVQRFDQAFGGEKGSGITFKNLTYAIAAFERTIISQNSRFDRYARDDQAALNSSEQRGLNIFRSLKTRCFECHNFPTFANPDFKIIGVPDIPNTGPDLGRGEIAGKAYNRAFKVPTLRNIALTAPYMHNGVFQTLEEVIDFYSQGGGRGQGLDIPNMDDKIRKFKLSSSEKSDLIAFLHCLTDESEKPKFPDAVPSGLSVVPRLTNQSPELAAFHQHTKPHPRSRVQKVERTITVPVGQSIQDGINLAVSGDVVRVMPGHYHETLSVDVSGITIQGIEIDGKKPVLDGKQVLADGLVGSGSNLEIRNFNVVNYTANGLMINGALNVTFADIYCENTGLYGIYPVECVGVKVERCEVTRARDAGIYVGQSKDIVVRDCIVYGNVTGIEIENSVGAVVENNEAYDNAGGILVFLLPNNPSKVSRNCKVIGNRVHDNNHENFADPNSAVSGVPSGTGILIMAADEVEITQNEIQDNNSYGVAIVGLDIDSTEPTSYDVNPVPQSCWVHENTMKNNGLDPDPSVLKLGLPGADLLWDLSGYDNSWDQPSARSMPPILPNKSWPDILRRANWRLWKILSSI